MLPACGHSVCHMLQSPCLPIMVACAPSQTVNPDKPFVSVTLLLLREYTVTKSNLRKQEWDWRGWWFLRGKSSWWRSSLQQAAGTAIGAGSWEITASTTNTERELGKRRARLVPKPVPRDALPPATPPTADQVFQHPNLQGTFFIQTTTAFWSETLPQQ